MTLAKQRQALITQLEALGILPTTTDHVQNHHVGDSDYSRKVIQPWNVWLEYKLNPWDGDIIKRTLRSKTVIGRSPTEIRIEDYEKIQHIAAERIRQLKAGFE